MQTKEVQNDIGAIEELKKALQEAENHPAEQKPVSKEQWKDGGDCDACRRQAYCGTPCKAKKVRAAKEIQTERDRVMQKMIMDMMKDAKEVEGTDDGETAADECTET